MPVAVSYKKFRFVPITVVWFNTQPTFRFGGGSIFNILRQSTTLTADIAAGSITHYRSKTTILDLTKPEEQLWEKLNPKSCRYEVRKITKMIDAGEQVQIEQHTDLSQFLKLANDYIRTKGYSRPLTLGHFQRYLSSNCGQLRTISYQGQLLGGNFYIMDYPFRIRLLYSFNNRFENKQIEKLSGPCMRYLHWCGIRDFRIQGYRKYDFGGVDTDPSALTYGISKFKLSFGGDVVEEDNYVFVSNRLLSNAYRLYKRFGTR